MKQTSNFVKLWGSALTVLICCLMTIQVHAQNPTVKGTVFDSLGPVTGVSILVEGTTTGCITDIDGNFEISAPADAKLTLSFIGYHTKTVEVAGRDFIEILLEEDTELLNEVVVVGYGVQKKSDLTGSIASVKAKDMVKTTPSGNIADALQGRMAGVSILSGSGDPTSGNTIRVRGVNSVTAETGPLLVVDGFIGGSLDALNPADIASIEVLKDASAAAVYGSRGANGVILVTTKTPDKDKITVTANAFVNLKTRMKKFDTLSPYEYALLANDYGKEYQESRGKDPIIYYTDEQLADLKAGNGGYNYADNIFRDVAVAQNYDFSVSGSSKKTSYLASFRYENNQGVIQKSDSEHYNWRLKVDSTIKKWLKVGANFYGDYRVYNSPRINKYDGLIQQALYFPPTILPKNEKGEYNNMLIDGSPQYNPMGMIWESKQQGQRLKNNLQGYVEFKIIDGLTFRSQFGVTFDNQLHRSVENEDSYGNFKNSLTTAKAESMWNINWLNTNILSYVKEFNSNHRINLTAVFEQASANNYRHKGIANELAFDKLGWDALNWSEKNLSQVESYATRNTLMSGMFRINYVLMNRYMFTASIRADGSSRLYKKWDYFPSAAFAWDMKNEKWLKDVSWLNQLKFRVSYGSVGNQSVEPYRIYSQMVPVANADGTTSYTVGRPAAPYLRWEHNNQENVGIDFAVLDNRLKISAEWYNKESKDILLEVAQPSHMGYEKLLKNAGAIRNTGFEFLIGGDPFLTEKFSWHTDLTLSYNVGKFTKIPTMDHTQIMAGQHDKAIYRMVEGEKIGTFWGYKYDGVWQEEDINAPFVNANGDQNGKTNGQQYKAKPGNAKYIDVNGDGKLNSDDMGIIGCGQPTFNWGWNNSFTIGDFDLSFFIIGFHDFDIYNATDQIGYNILKGQQVCFVTPKRDLQNRWTKENTNSRIPGFVEDKTSTAKDAFSDRFVEKGGFVKVKSITLGYSLPQKVCEKIHINNLRFYFSAQNPFMITKYSGFDPEATLGSPLTPGVDWAAYPNSRNFMFGLNFSF